MENLEKRIEEIHNLISITDLEEFAQKIFPYIENIHIRN